MTGVAGQPGSDDVLAHTLPHYSRILLGEMTPSLHVGDNTHSGQMYISVVRIKILFSTLCFLVFSKCFPVNVYHRENVITKSVISRKPCSLVQPEWKIVC